MTYMQRNRDKRANPALLVPGARSVICLGMAYPPPVEAPDSGLHGRLSAFARGSDYHVSVKAKLRELWAYIGQIAPVPPTGRYYVDTGPVLERELAQRAGLGWCGKNTCLISRTTGSYVFLGEIITDLELEYDPPASNRCGSCTRCLDACPTGALVAPHVLDARRCIAYLTIESRDAIPRDLRPLMDNWVFGCDACQQVCPWNHRARGARGVPGEPVSQDTRDLRQVLALDPDGFSQCFRGSPVKRARRSGLLRNAAVALGNSGDRRALPVLVRALEQDPEPLVRSHAAWALGRLGGVEARKALSQARCHEADPVTVAEIQQALAAVQGRPVGPPPTE